MIGGHQSFFRPRDGAETVQHGCSQSTAIIDLYAFLGRDGDAFLPTVMKTEATTRARWLGAVPPRALRGAEPNAVCFLDVHGRRHHYRDAPG